MDSQHKLSRWEQRAEWPLAIIALIFLAAFAADVLIQPQGVLDVAIDVVQGVAWAVFATDYVVRLALAPNRRQWFFKHLLDVAIVLLPLLRPLRLLRIVILIAALQKALGSAIRGRVVVYTVSGAVLLVFVASLAVLDAERHAPDSDIQTYGQALWWSMTTITTVGYGDLYPISVQGRIIAVLLMIGGISLVGFITATLASWIVQRVAEEETDNRTATAAQIEELHSEVRLLAAEVRRLRADDEPAPES